jgi:hypothetical protein
MYWEIPQGSVLNVQGLNCHLPPVGYVQNMVTGELEHRGVYQRSDIETEQYWERIALPAWYNETMKRWDAYDRKKKEGDDEFYDEHLEAYKGQEWDRRLNGFWFMNEGAAVYITGAHYFFMQWVMIDIGYPKFRFPDMEYFYFQQYCIEDDNCMGMLEITKRRFGKTYRGGVFVLDYPTRTKMTNGGIQSKTGADGKTVFAKAVVDPFKKLPRFFKPEYDLAGGVTPKSELRFQNTNVRGKKAEQNLDKEELGSLINYQTADILAFDGQKLHRYFSDEWAKTIECNIYDRHDVVRYCFMDDEGRIIGKALYSSTVEQLDTDKDGVQEGAKKLWDDSDHLHKGENGRTPSGLYRFFMPADRAKKFDIYGNPNREVALAEILADRKTVEHNPRALASRMRKEALTIEEAFSIDGEDCSFNVLNIQEQRKKIADERPPLRQVMFIADGKGGASFKDDKNGLWWILDLRTGKENKYTGQQYKLPSNTSAGLISIDSYSGYQSGRKYGSMACAFIFDKRKNMFIGMYYGRPQYKEQLHEQMMLAGLYYGFKIYYECTADDYEGYFRTRNMLGYLGRFPMAAIEPEKRDKTERLYGFPITPFAMTKQLDEMILYIEHSCHLIWFDKLLEQCLVFDPYNRTKSDCVVSAMIGVVSAIDISLKPPTPKSPLIKVY